MTLFQAEEPSFPSSSLCLSSSLMFLSNSDSPERCTAAPAPAAQVKACRPLSPTRHPRCHPPPLRLLRPRTAVQRPGGAGRRRHPAARGRNPRHGNIWPRCLPHLLVLHFSSYFSLPLAFLFLFSSLVSFTILVFCSHNLFHHLLNIQCTFDFIKECLLRWITTKSRYEKGRVKYSKISTISPSKC